MTKNAIKITSESVEAGGKLRAQQTALHELKPIVASMIDSVRGDEELTITVEVTKVEDKPKAKPATKPKEEKNAKSDTKSATKHSSQPYKASEPTQEQPDDGADTEATEPVNPDPDQEVDPLQKS